MRPSSPRWPWPDLATALRCAGYTTRAQQADVLEVTERTIERWQTAGVPDPQADHAAIRIGSHPALIWTTWHHGADDRVAPLRDTDAA